jgi:hypothetical protein
VPVNPGLKKRASTRGNFRLQTRTRLGDYFFPFFRAVLREATTIAANSSASCKSLSTSSKGISRVSGKNSSQKDDSTANRFVRCLKDITTLYNYVILSWQELSKRFGVSVPRPSFAILRFVPGVLARSRSFFLGACATLGQLLEVLISDSESAFSWFGVPR